MSKGAIIWFGEVASISTDMAAQARVAQSGPATSNAAAVVSFLARCNGRDAWHGWPTDPTLEATPLSWFEACGQAAVAEKIQPAVLDGTSYLPLGQFPQPPVYSRSLNNIFAKLWSVRTS